MHFCEVNESIGSYTAFINRSTRKRMGIKLTAMYALKNKVQLIGNLGGAPEVKNTESGKKLVRFSVATNESYRNAKGERVKETQWHNVIAWGTVAEVVEKYLVKGSEIALEGKLIYRNYTDKEGLKKSVTEIQMNEMLMLGAKPGV
jgi:single-strand DNA-binding protein